jgi:hypothetical protein
LSFRQNENGAREREGEREGREKENEGREEGKREKAKAYLQNIMTHLENNNKLHPQILLHPLHPLHIHKRIFILSRQPLHKL